MTGNIQDEIPLKFICPVTGRLMKKPVYLKEVRRRIATKNMPSLSCRKLDKSLPMTRRPAVDHKLQEANTYGKFGAESRTQEMKGHPTNPFVNVRANARVEHCGITT